jgi:hypoxanthine phosphoribosyltransferase
VESQEFLDLTEKDVLLVEDVLDTGKTIAHAREWVIQKGAASVSTCVLLAKEGYQDSAFPNPDYVGFTIPNVFVVGYGLDYREKYRNLRCVGVLSSRIYAPEDRPAGIDP